MFNDNNIIIQSVRAVKTRNLDVKSIVTHLRLEYDLRRVVQLLSSLLRQQETAVLFIDLNVTGLPRAGRLMDGARGVSYVRALCAAHQGGQFKGRYLKFTSTLILTTLFIIEHFTSTMPKIHIFPKIYIAKKRKSL